MKYAYILATCLIIPPLTIAAPICGTPNHISEVIVNNVSDLGLLAIPDNIKDAHPISLIFPAYAPQEKAIHTVLITLPNNSNNVIHVKQFPSLESVCDIPIPNVPTIDSKKLLIDIITIKVSGVNQCSVSNVETCIAK